MVSTSDRSEIASAAMVAMEPLVELLLELGVNCPEAESLFRGVFVHRARDLLARQGREVPSDVRVALVTGVHRNFVREILRARPKIAPERRRRGLKWDHLVIGWQTDAKYIGADGNPLTLCRTGPEPSLKSLIKDYLPNAPLESTIAQLLRRGLVRILPNDQIQLRSIVARGKRYAFAKVTKMGVLGRDFLEVLRRNLAEPTNAMFHGTIPSVLIDASRAIAVREAIRARATKFLYALGNELTDEAEANKKIPGKVGTRDTKVTLTVFATETKAD